MEKREYYYFREPTMISQVQMQTALERYGPWFLSIIGMLIAPYVSLPDEELYLNAIATVGALLASLTGVSIGSLLTLSQTDIGKALQKRGWYKILMRYAHVSVFVSLLMTLAAIAGFFITDEYENLYKVILFGLTFLALSAFYRVFSLLIKIGGFYREER